MPWSKYSLGKNLQVALNEKRKKIEALSWVQTSYFWRVSNILSLKKLVLIITFPLYMAL